MINFIYGNPGSGKTTLINSAILEDAKNGHKVILIVPEQFTVSAEYDIIKLLPPAAQLYVEVLNFTRLANSLFRIYGGVSYSFVTKAHEKLIMWRAIKASLPFLREYKLTSFDDFTLTDAMLATYKEITAAGVSIDQIENASDICNNSMLSAKIKDIALIGSIYSSMLNEKFSDSNSELAKLVSLLNNTICFNNVNIYIDGFTSFTGLEHKIIYELMRQADNVYITLGISSPSYNGIDTISLKECSDRLRRDCASLGKKQKSIILGENKRTNSPILKTISSELWAMEKTDCITSGCSISDAIELYKAADIYDECEFAAAKARELVECGYRYKEIAIIARNIDKYRGIIEPALDNMNLKYFISEKTDLSISPIAKFILSAIKIITHGWRRSDIIAHLKTGLCGISPHDSDIFECYTAKWNISGKSFLSEQPWNMNPDGYTTILTERGSEVLDTVNKVRDQIVSNLKLFNAKLKAAQSYQDMCAATMQYLDDLDIRNAMLKLSSEYLASDNIREASDCARMFEIALDSLDCICDVFNENDKPDVDTFATALKIAFSESTLGSIPTSQDEMVLGSANILRTEKIKCAIILGVCDGEFPGPTESCGLFNYHDRAILAEQGIPLAGNYESVASDELFFFRRAVSTPSEKLIVFTCGDSEPSIGFTRLLNILPECKARDTSSLLLDRIKTLKAVSEYAPLLSQTTEGAALDMLVNEYNSGISGKDSIQVSADHDSIDINLIRELHGKELSLTQSKTEAFLNCKFAFSCQYYLHLDDGKKAEFSFNNIGTFIHHVLEKFLFRVYVINRGIIPDQEEIQSIINEIIEKYISDLLPDSMSRNARLMHLIDRLKASSLLIIEDLLNEFSDSRFKPEFFELKIGTKGIPSVKITLKNGTKVSINGIVDRVDVYRNNGKAYIRVIDYKTGNKTFSISDIEEGLNLQMFLYIFSLTYGNKRELSKIFNGDPIAASVAYLSIDSSKQQASRFDNADNSKSFTSSIIRTGLILDDEDVIDAVSISKDDRLLMRSARKNSFINNESLTLLYEEICRVISDIGEEILSGNINAKPKEDKNACKYCRYYAICRTSHKNNG